MLQTNEQIGWCMIETGGSIGSSEFMNARYGSKRCKVIKSFDTEEEAKECAKRWNKMLTPCEKRYYHIRYSAVKSVNVKFVDNQ